MSAWEADWVERRVILRAVSSIENLRKAECPTCGKVFRLLLIGARNPDRHQVYATCQTDCPGGKTTMVWERLYGSVRSAADVEIEICAAAREEASRRMTAKEGKS